MSSILDRLFPDPAELAELRDRTVQLTRENQRLRAHLATAHRQRSTALYAATVAHAANDELQRRLSARHCERCARTAWLEEQNELLRTQLATQRDSQ
jgi:cell shape-determining protein MreC